MTGSGKINIKKVSARVASILISLALTIASAVILDDTKDLSNNTIWKSTLVLTIFYALSVVHSIIMLIIILIVRPEESDNKKSKNAVDGAFGLVILALMIWHMVVFYNQGGRDIRDESEALYIIAFIYVILGLIGFSVLGFIFCIILPCYGIALCIKGRD